MFVDSHAHLEGPKFDADREQVLVRASEAGVESILCIGNGTGPGTLDCALKLAAAHEGIYASTGIHPHEAESATDTAYGEMERIASQPRVIAWGEIGLDYFYDHSPRETQQRVFLEQMKMAATANKPIIIHCRPSDGSENAWDDTLRLLREHWAVTALGGILHCFSGERKHAEAAIEMGFLVSFAGNVTFSKANSIRDVARSLPLDRMLIETDSPYLAPVPHRGKRNEPAFVAQTAAYIAALRNTTQEEIGQATSENFRRFFRLGDLAIPQ